MARYPSGKQWVPLSPRISQARHNPFDEFTDIVFAKSYISQLKKEREMRNQTSIGSTAFRVSNNSLSGVAVCTTKGFLSRVMGLTSKEESLAARAGGDIHRVLARWYKGELASAMDAAAFFESIYRAHADANAKTQDDRLRWDNVSKVVETYLVQHAPSAFPYQVLPQLIELELGVEGSVLYPLYLDDDKEFEFHAILDLIVQDATTRNLLVVDWKTTGWLNSLWVKQWGMSSQLTGYIWAARKLMEGYTVMGAMVGAIELPNLPTSERKCKTHGVPFSQCGRYHSKSEIVGPLVRTPYQMEKWRETAIGLAKRLRELTRVPLTRMHELSMEGMFNGGCNAYGGCEFLRFCQTGRELRMIGQLLTTR